MRRLLIAILVGLSACATAPSGNDLTSRLVSWHGASTGELVAVLGEPTIKENGTWTWQFSGREKSRGGNSRHRSANTGSLSVLRGCASCSMSGSDGKVVTPATYFDSDGTSTETPHFCTYLGYVENGMVIKLTTLSRPRLHCRFDELPLRSI